MKITIRNLQKKIPINPKRINSAILNSLSRASAKKFGEITVSFVNDKEIRQMNSRFLKTPTPTDVLAFDLGEAADIVISTQTAERNARKFKTNPLYESYLYVVHAALHLSGYSDATEKQRGLMQNKAESILRRLNVWP